MSTYTREETEAVRIRLSQLLKESRYIHTLGTAYTAAALAMRYDADVQKAYMAGLLHDCAKCLSEKELITGCFENGILLDEAQLKSPQVLHAVYAPVMIRKEFGITDAELLSAVRFHTTGKENMTLLEKILFTADYIEATRKEIPGLSKARRLAFQDLDSAVRLILSATVSYLEQQGTLIVKDTLLAWRYYAGE